MIGLGSYMVLMIAIFSFLSIKEACVLLTLPSEKNVKSKVTNFITVCVISILCDDEIEPIEITRMLENLGIYHLSAEEAKDIVERRVEYWK